MDKFIQKFSFDFVTNQRTHKVSDLAKQFPEFNLNTLKKDLQYLRDEQVLIMIGKGRGTVYTLVEKE